MKALTFLLYLIITLIPFGQLLRYSYGAVSVSAVDIVVAALFISTVVFALSKKPDLPLLARPLSLFMLIALVSLAINSARYPMIEIRVGSLYLVRFVLYTSVYFASYYVSLHAAKQRLTLLWLFIAGVCASVLGLLQYQLYPNLRNLMYLDWDPHEYRVFGTYFDSGFAGILLALTFLLGLYIFNTYNKYRSYIAAAMTVVFAALLLTYSRSSYLALVTGSLVYSFYKKQVYFALFIILLLASLLFVLPQPSPTSEATKLARTASIDARIDNSQDALPIITNNPIFGIGFNMTRFEKRDRNLLPSYEWRENNAGAGFDNSFIFVLVTTGFIGFIAYLWIWLRILYGEYKRFINNYIFSAVVASSTVALLAHGMFNNTLFYPWTLVWLYLLLGVTHANRFSR